MAAVSIILSFANPYAWLDAVVLIASMGAAKPIDEQQTFSGTMLASLLWFVFLAAANRKLMGLLRSAQAWRRLDVGIVLLMAYPAIGLVEDFVRSPW